MRRRGAAALGLGLAGRCGGDETVMAGERDGETRGVGVGVERDDEAKGARMGAGWTARDRRRREWGCLQCPQRVCAVPRRFRAEVQCSRELRADERTQAHGSDARARDACQQRTARGRRGGRGCANLPYRAGDRPQQLAGTYRTRESLACALDRAVETGSGLGGPSRFIISRLRAPPSLPLVCTGLVCTRDAAYTGHHSHYHPFLGRAHLGAAPRRRRCFLILHFLTRTVRTAHTRDPARARRSSSSSQVSPEPHRPRVRPVPSQKGPS